MILYSIYDSFGWPRNTKSHKIAKKKNVDVVRLYDECMISNFSAGICLKTRRPFQTEIQEHQSNKIKKCLRSIA